MNLASFSQGVRNLKCFVPQQDLAANHLISTFIYLKSKTTFQEFMLGGDTDLIKNVVPTIAYRSKE